MPVPPSSVGAAGYVYAGTITTRLRCARRAVMDGVIDGPISTAPEAPPFRLTGSWHWSVPSSHVGVSAPPADAGMHTDARVVVGQARCLPRESILLAAERTGLRRSAKPHPVPDPRKDPIPVHCAGAACVRF